MAILLDFRNIASAAMSVAVSRGDHFEPNNLLLGKLRYYNSTWRDEYGEMVLCGESFSWRTKVFEHYKGQRRLAKANQTEETDPELYAVYKSIDEFWEISEEFGPYKCLRVRGAEGDDVIAALAMTPGKHLVVSADKDLSQLTRFENVKCFNPIKKKFIDNGKTFWHQLVVRGDPGDGVPNILSDDDTFMVRDKRQRQLRQNVVDQIVNSDDPEAEILSMKFSGIFSEQVLLNYRRNKRLIDLTQIPRGLCDVAIEKFNEIFEKRDIMNYLVKLKAPSYIGKINDFVPVRQVIENKVDIF